MKTCVLIAIAIARVTDSAESAAAAAARRSRISRSTIHTMRTLRYIEEGGMVVVNSLCRKNPLRIRDWFYRPFFFFLHAFSLFIGDKI